MADDEELGLENQLELQLEDQRESLTALKEALIFDPTNTELSSVHEELILGIRDTEEGLFHLKKSRLLQEADSLLSKESSVQNIAAEALDPTNSEAETLEEETYSVGSKCRFRHTDGQWYNGQIIGVDGSSARVTFLQPTSENMLICNFFQQQRCRFGNNCRLSHGIDIPVSSLKRYIPTTWNQSLVGSSIWATSVSSPGIWRKAELKSWDDTKGHGEVVFEGDRTTLKVNLSSLSLSQYAQMTTDSESSDGASSSVQSGDSEIDISDDEISGGLGFMDVQRGIQTDTAVFAKWENHTRGIASKMMANMGYREGMGLGVSGQGIVDPILVKVLKPKQSLDHAFLEKDEGKEKKKVKRRSRGGKRKRDKKHAEATRAEKEQEDSEPNPDVFSFINNQLTQNGSTVKRRDVKNVGAGKKEDRKSLVGYDDEVRELRVQVGKLEEMVSRNRKEKAVFEAFSKRLHDTRKALAEAEAMKASASNEVVSKEKEKRWLKF
ncbi:hypothetical protein ACHQM5_030049 [Ranunculus cassubicifolius]